MKPSSRPTTRENWRWLHQLEMPTASLWELLAFLGKTPFEFQNQAVRYQGSIDLESAFLDDSGFFLTSKPSLNLDTAKLDNIFVVETEDQVPGRIEFDFHKRDSSLALTQANPQILRHLTTLFGWEFKPETPGLQTARALATPPVCKCCAGAAGARRLSTGNNPLVPIFKSFIESGHPLTLALNSSGLNPVTNLRPTNLSHSAGLLSLYGDYNEVTIDVGHLHGLLVQRTSREGFPLCELSLINSHGTPFATLSVPAHLFQNTWRICLGNANGFYQTVTEG